MYFDILNLAAMCRSEALKCLRAGRVELAAKWIDMGKDCCRTARRARITFMTLGDKPLPG